MSLGYSVLKKTMKIILKQNVHTKQVLVSFGFLSSSGFENTNNVLSYEQYIFFSTQNKLVGDVIAIAHNK